MKVLVIDDSLLARRSVINVYKEAEPGTEFIEAENGAVGVERYKEHAPDLVFLDLTMPVMDGYEALEQLMQINPDARVVIISADIQPKAKERVLATGGQSDDRKTD
jgi:CheY-like chemotaxis protein